MLAKVLQRLRGVPFQLHSQRLALFAVCANQVNRCLNSMISLVARYAG